MNLLQQILFMPDAVVYQATLKDETPGPIILGIRVREHFAFFHGKSSICADWDGVECHQLGLGAFMFLVQNYEVALCALDETIKAYPDVDWTFTTQPQARIATHSIPLVTMKEYFNDLAFNEIKEPMTYLEWEQDRLKQHEELNADSNLVN